MSRSANLTLKRLVYSAVSIALAQVLPLITGNIPEIGNMLCPMHLPVLLCGFLCGWEYGLVVGFCSPLLRFCIFGMPPIFPTGIAMAFELATYGALSGLLYKLLPKKIPYIYISLISAMVGGRVVWGIARYILSGVSGKAFTMAAFISGAITTAIPGIIVQIILVPVIVMAMKRAGFVLNH